MIRRTLRVAAAQLTIAFLFGMPCSVLAQHLPMPAVENQSSKEKVKPRKDIDDVESAPALAPSMTKPIRPAAKPLRRPAPKHAPAKKLTH